MSYVTIPQWPRTNKWTSLGRAVCNLSYIYTVCNLSYVTCLVYLKKQQTTSARTSQTVSINTIRLY